MAVNKKYMVYDPKGNALQIDAKDLNSYRQQGYALQMADGSKKNLAGTTGSTMEVSADLKARGLMKDNSNPVAGQPAAPMAKAATPAAISAPTPTVAAVATPQYDINGEIERLKQAQIQQRYAALDQSRNNAMSRLQTERAGLAPQYYNARNQETSRSQLGARNFAEYMAARGQSNAGISGQAEIARNVTLAGNVGNLVRQERAANDDISRRTSDVESEYQFGRANAMSEAEAQAAQQRIDELIRLRDMARDDARYASESAYRNSRDTRTDYVDDRNYDRGVLESDRGYDYQVDRDTRADYESDRNYDRAVLESNRNYDRGVLESDRAYNEDLRRYEQDFTENQRRWNSEFAFNQSQQSFNERQQQIDNAVRNRQLSMQEADLQLSRDKYAADNDPNSLDNQIKRQQLYNMQNPPPEQPTATEAQRAEEAKLQQVLDSKPTEAERLNWIESNKVNIIQTFGRSYYLSLIETNGGVGD